jgi:hypothetical protein
MYLTRKVNAYPPQSTVTIVPVPRTVSATSANCLITFDESFKDLVKQTKTLVRVFKSFLNSFKSVISSRVDFCPAFFPQQLKNNMQNTFSRIILSFN